MIRARIASFLKTIRIDAHAVWLAARDPRTPPFARAFGLLVAAYAASPIDLVPDFIPVLGLLDDAIIVPLGVWLFVRMVPASVFAECRAAAAIAARRPASRTGMLIVIAMWAACAALAWLWFARAR